MITARNYAAQAERDLSQNSNNSNFWRNLNDHERNYLAHADLIGHLICEAVHFVMPDDAKIFDDDCKGLEGQILHLPFDTITLSFYDSIHDLKIIAIALSVDDGDQINIYGCYYDSGLCVWVIEPAILAIYPKKYNYKEHYGGRIIPLEQNYDTKSFNLYRNAVYEFLEALSCRNVTTVNYQDASPANSKRIKSGKLPIYETKMLVINTKSTPSEYRGTDGYHASPRQHLRRGHIRRHPTAGNIWINSCVVGDADKGVINKQYLVL